MEWSYEIFLEKVIELSAITLLNIIVLKEDLTIINA